LKKNGAAVRGRSSKKAREIPEKIKSELIEKNGAEVIGAN